MKNLNRIFPFIAGAVVFLFGMNYINLGLWRDEAFSIKKFVLVDFVRTATHYPEPNNHVFLSLFHNVLTRLMGIRDYHELMDYVPALRFVQIVIGLLTLLMVYRFGKKFINRETGVIASIMFATTLTFLNFLVQLRGYNISMLFLILSMYSVYSYLSDPRLKYLVGTSLSLFCLVYTMPSNLYFFVGLMLVLVVRWVLNYSRSSEQNLIRRMYAGDNRGYWNLLLAGAISGILFVVAYLPILDEMLLDKYLNDRPDNRFFALSDRLPEFLLDAVSGRPIMILLSLVGLAYMALNEKLRPNLWKWLVLLFLLFMPFLFSFFQNNSSFARTFVYVTPIYALLLAIPVGLSLRHLSWGSGKKTAAISGIYVYCIVCVVIQYQTIQHQLSENLNYSARAQDNIFAYFQANTYNPAATAAFMSDLYEKDPHPVVLSPRELDNVTLVDYLNKYHVNNYFLRQYKSIRNKPDSRRLHVLVSHSPFINEKSIIQKRVVLYSKRMKASSYRVGRFAALVEFMLENEKTDAFYVISSYDHFFWEHFANYYKNEYQIVPLTREQNSFNIYLFNKKLPTKSN